MKKYKNIIRGCLFVLVFAVFLGTLSLFLVVPRETGIQNEPDATIDYLVTGDSESYTSVSPMAIYKQFGYTGYNLGISSQYIQDAYYSLTDALAAQNPKILFLETNFLFRERNVKDEFENSWGRMIEHNLPILELHNQWKYLLSLDPYQESSKLQNPLKGFRYYTWIAPYTGGNYTTPTEKRKTIPESTLNYLDDIFELGKQHNIKIVFYSSLSPTNWSYAAHNSVSDYAKERGVDYIDLNILADEIGIDWTTDTHDKGDHLNYNGSVKTTKKIAEYMESTGLLRDHRGNPEYQNWETLVEKYEKTTSRGSSKS